MVLSHVLTAIVCAIWGTLVWIKTGKWGAEELLWKKYMDRWWW